MIENRIIPEAELRTFLPGQSLAGEAQALLLQQQSTWELARKGYKSLEDVRTKVFDFNGVEIHVQFNAGRIKSTMAKTDDSSIKARPCFLCHQNLPPDQKGILYHDDYLLLVNPYPICPEHFTIAKIEHQPQLIRGEIEVLFDLARDMAPEFASFYNGPRCGASAPDHMHLQAGTRSFLPLLEGYQTARERFGRLLADTGGVRAFGLDRYLPPFLALESSSVPSLLGAFATLYSTYESIVGANQEPMMNLACWFDDGQWTLVVFPRSKHRPARFFAEGPRQLRVSPAVLDLCGVITIPHEEDFVKMRAGDVEEILEEVVLDTESFRDLTGALADALSP